MQTKSKAGRFFHNDLPCLVGSSNLDVDLCVHEGTSMTDLTRLKTLLQMLKTLLQMLKKKSEKRDFQTFNLNSKLFGCPSIIV